MTETEPNNEEFSESGLYEFRIEGHLSDKWEAWFEGLSITHERDGTTSLRGQVADQSALHSILLKIRNVNLNLISVNRITADEERRIMK